MFCFTYNGIDINNNQYEDNQYLYSIISMESLQSKLSVSAMTANLRIFTEPRGLIRLLQFIFAIFAFATACSGSSSVLLSNSRNNSISASWSYPYNLKNTQIISDNKPEKPISSANDIKPSAEFFVFTGVTSMLLSLGFAIVYVLMDQRYRNDERLPLIDFIVILIWSIFWIAGSAAWAKGVSNIRTQTSWESIAKRSDFCSEALSCKEVYSGTYGSIIVSVIFGFLNFILWAGSAWFVYKETRLFKSGTAQQQQQQESSEQPSNFSNFGAPTIQQQSGIRSPNSMG
ncbi:unnamed protein product [Rotaria sordida]|uniref:MARVEL domain-containing protein n=2 Tax=Rotaria sordida TaxID=392033 RepID=A0A813U1L5_9BILA|nr:unnamed protein product [Rotaria sordida]